MKKFRTTIVHIHFCYTWQCMEKIGSVTFVTFGIYQRYCKNWLAR